MDDERDEESTTLLSIYPEIVVDTQNPHKFTLVIPVTPTEPITITFDAYTKSSAASLEDIPQDTRTVQHLPPLTLTATLLNGYPSEIFPRVDLDVTPAWLDFVKLKQLENDCAKLWEEYGRCQILFTFIDHLQQAADSMFDLGTHIHVSGKLKDALLDYNSTREKEVFAKSSYDCGICLETKRGTICHRIARCGHIFCRPCLQDYFNSAITEGSVTTVVCPDTTCGEKKPGQPKKRKTLHPRELIEIGIDEEHARRFVELKRKKKLEADKSTVFCPRPWCQAAARNPKHPPIPDNLNDYVDPDTDDEAGDAPPVYTKDTPDKNLPAAADRLTICSNLKCGLAFCRVCYAGWHGEFARCWPRNPSELSAEEKASYDYIRLHTSPCPTCASPAQKTMGCNHMQCFQCNTHFCYLCSAWLDPGNPYLHFNNNSNACYQRLWELEEGDEGQGGAFNGARMWEAEARAIAEALEDDNVAGPGDDNDPDDASDSDTDASEADAIDLAAVVDRRPPPPQVPEPAAQQIRQAVPRGPIRPPPGPIDPMHAQVLQREAAAAVAARDARPRPAVELVQERALEQIAAAANLYPPNAYPDADHIRRQRPHYRGRARRAVPFWNGVQPFEYGVRELQVQERRGRLNQQQGGGADAPGRGRGRGRGNGRGRGDHAGRGNVNLPLVDRGAARRVMGDDWADRNPAAILRFVNMAGQDREDEWDSDELEGDERFDIPAAEAEEDGNQPEVLVRI